MLLTLFTSSSPKAIVINNNSISSDTIHSPEIARLARKGGSIRAQSIARPTSWLTVVVAYTAITTLFSRSIRLHSYPAAVWSLSFHSVNTLKPSFAAQTLFSTSSSSGLTYGNAVRGGAASPPSARMAASVDDAATAIAMCPKLSGLRDKMAELGLDAYIVPSDDPHLSEYVPTSYKRRAYISGFGGSAGTAVVTADGAYLWTDGRYFNEATRDLDANHWTLMKDGQPKVPKIPTFLAVAAAKSSSSKPPYRVGIDPFVSSASFAKEITDAFQKQTPPQNTKNGEPIGIIDTLDREGNLIDYIWGKDRPATPTSAYRVHPLQYAGRSVSDKIKDVRDQMADKGATMSVFSALDDIAYLFNVRATGDIDTCPVGIAYGTVEKCEEDGGTGLVTIFCDDAKLVDAQVLEHLKSANVTVEPYDSILSRIQSHVETSPDHHKVWMDQSRTNYALTRMVPAPQLIDAQNAITPMKAAKNKAELEGMKLAHLKDGVAMARFIAWLTQTVAVEKKTVSEVEIDLVLTAFRKEQDGFIELSFPTIAGVGSNGAIIHYQAKEGTDLLQHLDTNQPILIDSGGQYTCGTTDVTRTWHFGEATPSFREYYTRVLKGNIGVDTMVFPEDTPGFVLDVFARKALWDVGRDYGHGTGHGVGAALNVHEGPMSISPRWGNTETLKKGMIVSNEPGYYEDGVCGIRIENLLSITYVNDEDNLAFEQNLKEGDEGYPTLPSGRKRFLKFERLTMIPIQKNLIMTNLMTNEELDWLDNYHREVFQAVGPLLEEGTPEMLWLTEACAEIDRS